MGGDFIAFHDARRDVWVALNLRSGFSCTFGSFEEAVGWIDGR